MFQFQPSPLTNFASKVNRKAKEKPTNNQIGIGVRLRRLQYPRLQLHTIFLLPHLRVDTLCIVKIRRLSEPDSICLCPRRRKSQFVLGHRKKTRMKRSRSLLPRTFAVPPTLLRWLCRANPSSVCFAAKPSPKNKLVSAPRAACRTAWSQRDHRWLPGVLRRLATSKVPVFIHLT